MTGGQGIGWTCADPSAIVPNLLYRNDASESMSMAYHMELTCVYFIVMMIHHERNDVVFFSFFTIYRTWVCWQLLCSFLIVLMIGTAKIN